MKVLLIDNFHYRRGGAEVVYLNTADMLLEHGHEVVFFSQKWDENIETNDSKYFPTGYSVRSVGVLNKLKCIRNYFYNTDAAVSLDSLIKTEKPDIAHIHLFWGGLSPSIYRMLKRHNIPIVHSVHDYRMVCPGYAFKNGKDEICEKCEGKKFYHCLLNRCSKGSLLMSALMTSEMYYRNWAHHPADYIDRFLYVSHFCEEKHMQYDKKFLPEKSVVLYNFSNSDVLKCKNSTLDTFDNYYLYYGRLSFEKGIPTLIDAFSKYTDLKLKVVGTGPLDEQLKSKCRNINANNIEFLGFKTGAELYNLIANAKFVCVPSEWYENNPMTIVESYSLRTPVIGAAIGGITEIVVDGKTGFTFESGNVESLCAAIDKTLSVDKDTYKSMKQHAEDFASENFNPEKYCQKLIEIYKALIQKNN